MEVRPSNTLSAHAETFIPDQFTLGEQSLSSVNLANIFNTMDARIFLLFVLAAPLVYGEDLHLERSSEPAQPLMILTIMIRDPSLNLSFLRRQKNRKCIVHLPETSSRSSGQCLCAGRSLSPAEISTVQRYTAIEE